MIVILVISLMYCAAMTCWRIKRRPPVLQNVKSTVHKDIVAEQTSLRVIHKVNLLHTNENFAFHMHNLLALFFLVLRVIGHKKWPTCPGPKSPIFLFFWLLTTTMGLVKTHPIFRAWSTTVAGYSHAPLSASWEGWIWKNCLFLHTRKQLAILLSMVG